MSHFRKSTGWFMLLTLPFMTTFARESQKESYVLGRWSRSQTECKTPELKFTDTQLTISIKADGTPVSFEYYDIHYLASTDNILVKLNKKHPYSKAPNKESLRFEIIDNNTMLLEQVKYKKPKFFRCAK